MPTIKKTKRGFIVTHTTKEVFGVDDPSEEAASAIDNNYWLLKADGTNLMVKSTASQVKFNLEEIQKFVGGYFEIIRAGQRLMYIHDDARRLDLPINQLASALAGQTILGNVLLLPKGRRS